LGIEVQDHRRGFARRVAAQPPLAPAGGQPFETDRGGQGDPGQVLGGGTGSVLAFPLGHGAAGYAYGKGELRLRHGGSQPGLADTAEQLRHVFPRRNGLASPCPARPVWCGLACRFAPVPAARRAPDSGTPITILGAWRRYAATRVRPPVPGRAGSQAPRAFPGRAGVGPPSKSPHHVPGAFPVGAGGGWGLESAAAPPHLPARPRWPGLPAARIIGTRWARVLIVLAHVIEQKGKTRKAMNIKP